MAQEPKKKHSKAVKRTRRASINLLAKPLAQCPNCNANKLSHMACPECGFYKGKITEAAERVTVTKA
jgi:large subunit ribosomal protein L32